VSGANAIVAIAVYHLSSRGRTVAFAALGGGLAAAWMLRRAGFVPGPAAAAVLGTGIALFVTLVLRAGTRRDDWLLFSAPLYGRELARGLAVAPCLIATAAVLAAVLPAGAGMRAELAAFLTPPAVTLVALSATLREGAARLRILGSAALTGIAVGSLLQWVPRTQTADAAASLFALAAGFVALRAYGEGLARHDLFPT
jgi:hypothetical protein